VTLTDSLKRLRKGLGSVAGGIMCGTQASDRLIVVVSAHEITGDRREWRRSAAIP